jgi:hypothetical protein
MFQNPFDVKRKMKIYRMVFELAVESGGLSIVHQLPDFLINHKG